MYAVRAPHGGVTDGCGLTHCEPMLLRLCRACMVRSGEGESGSERRGLATPRDLGKTNFYTPSAINTMHSLQYRLYQPSLITTYVAAATR